MPATAMNTEMAAAELESLDTLLADLDIEETDSEEVLEALDAIEAEEEVVEEIEPDIDPAALDDEVLTDLDLAITRAEVYNSQESAPIATPEEQEEIKAKATKQRASRSSGASAAPRAPRDLSSVPAEFFVLTGDVAAMDEGTKEGAKTTVIGKKPTQKKVAEKFENLFIALSAGKAPSTYVMTAFKLLDEKKTITSGDLVGAYKAIGLREGTARSQTGQIMNLFSTVKIADRTGQMLKLRDDSNIAERLRKLAA